MAKQCRAVAALCLVDVIEGRSLAQAIVEHEKLVDEKDRGLLRELCYGSLRLFPRLDGIVNQLLNKPLKNKDLDIKMLMIIGIYQLSETRVPDHAAIDSVVKAAVALKKPWAKGLLNAVLRNWQRSSKDLLTSLKPNQSQAFPNWLYKRVKSEWPENWAAIIDASNTHPPLCLRVNEMRSTPLDYVQALKSSNIEAAPCEYAKQGVRLSNAVSVSSLPGFDDGLVSVQDESAQLCAELLNLQPDQTVLDACAAPGGKTCHILEKQPSVKSLTALDISKERLARIKENLTRLKLDAQLVCADASRLDDWWDGNHFDRILLDAPCSATGVIRRNPDIKIHRSAKDIVKLTELQLSLLEKLWQTLKPGGLLLYATCSILPDENTRLVERFCALTTNAEHIEIKANWGIKQDYGRQLLPAENSHDGFYYALISKKHS